MKKFLLVLISILATLFVLAAIVLGYFWWQNRASEKKAAIGQGEKVFASQIYKYKLSYPKNLYLLFGEDGSTLPAKLRLANFEKPETKPANNTIFDLIVSEDKDCKAIKDCAAVKELEGQNYSTKSATLSDTPAVRLTNLENVSKTVISTLTLFDGKIYRIDFSPSTVTAYEESKATYDKILDGFKFITNQEAAFFGTEKAQAATTCNDIDQQYAPATKITSEPLRTTNDTGQTFMPAKDTICRVDVDLENVNPEEATLWIYTGSGSLLAQKTQAISEGWNSFTLDSTISVTPEAEYKIQINILGAAGPKWRAGETGISNGYPRGHAIVAGFPENDLDFHFKEYYSVTTDDGGGITDPGTGTTTDGQPKAKPKAATATSVVKDTTPPKKPFNLNIIKLWLTGLTQTYVDLQWDKVTDEDLAGYLIYYGEKSGDYYYAIDNGTANTIRVKNLLPGGNYYFAARAYDKSSNLSEFSNEVTANLLRNIIINYWWILLILGGVLLTAIIYLIVLKKKEVRTKFV